MKIGDKVDCSHKKEYGACYEIAFVMQFYLDFELHRDCLIFYDWDENLL